MTSTDLLSAVLADPFDDGPRLVYADWLQENGEPERAEFIREAISRRNDGTENGWIIQPHVHHKNAAAFKIVLKDSQYLYSRGFPDEIRCTMAQWIGGEWTCPDCEGRGFLYGDYGHITSTEEGICPTCNGNTTIRTPGIAKAVCEAWPVTQVVFPEMEPVLVDGIDDEFSGRWIWWMGSYETFDSNQRNELPGFLNPVWPDVWAFDSRAAALAALSHAAVNYGRRLAGLPELENK